MRLGIPEFADRELQRAATTLYGVAATVVVVCGLRTLLALVSDYPIGRLLVVGAMVLVGLACMAAANSGRVRAGAVVLLCAGGLVATLDMLFSNAAIAPTYGGYSILVVGAGVLLGGWGAGTAAVLAVLVLAAIAQWNVVELVPQPSTDLTKWDVVRSLAVTLGALAGFIGFASGRVQAAFAAADDNAEQLVQANRLLTESQDQVLRAQKLEAVGTLAGAVAHDFNNDLLVIDGYTELLADPTTTVEDRARFALEVRQATDRSARLTRQLLALGRRQVFDPKPCTVDDLLARLRNVLATLLGEQHNLVLEAGAPSVQVLVDPAQLEQVLINLVINAGHATPPGGRIQVQTRVVDLDAVQAERWPPLRSGPHVELVVGDNGSGMNSETLARVFEPFFSTKGPGRGSGLGLSSVYLILQRSQGAIHIDSAPGVGTTVRCLLPALEGAAQGAADVAPVAERLDGLRVLLVEDEPAVRALVEQMLRSAGAAVTARSQPEAVLAAPPTVLHSVDVLVTDVVMPGMTGPELVAALEATLPGLPVVYVSGYLEGNMVDEGLLEPGVVLLQKPFSRADIVAAVAEAHRVASNGAQEHTG